MTARYINLHFTYFTYFNMTTCPMSSSPLVNSLVKNWLSRTAPDIDEPPFQFIHTYGFVCGRHDAAWQPRSRNPQDWDLEATGWIQESLAFLDSAVQLLHVRGAVCCWCTVLLEQSHYQALCVSLAAVWCHYDVLKQHGRSQQEISPEFPAL